MPDAIRVFATPQLDDQELEVIHRIDQMQENLGQWIQHEPRRWTGLVRKLMVARNIQGSNTIEGFHVSLEDAVAAVQGAEPQGAADQAWRAVSGYRDAMTYILGLADDPHFKFETALIRSLHYMMLREDTDQRPGTWRLGEVFVVDEDSGATVYEGPPPQMVPDLVDKLTDTLRAEEETSVLVRAGMAHLNLAMIHPFKDGNGRMARALQTLVLARGGIVAPEFSSLEEYLGGVQADYYRILAEVGAGRWNPDRDARPWIRFVLTAHFRQGQIIQRRRAEYEKTWEAVKAAAEQHELPDRVELALFDAALGGRIRNPTYREEVGISEYTAGRDLKAAVGTGFLTPIGERRGRSYVATEMLKALRRGARGPRRQLDDPFAPP